MGGAALSAPARRAIFEALVAMAWADHRLEREEILAVQAAGRVLALPEDALDALDAGPPPVASILGAPLSAHERRIVYTCAAWLANVDANEDTGEAALLRELAHGFGLEPTTAVRLHDEARALHARTPGSTPWWQELELVLAAAATKLG